VNVPLYSPTHGKSSAGLRWHSKIHGNRLSLAWNNTLKKRCAAAAL
jgi:hypothetical protein